MKCTLIAWAGWTHLAPQRARAAPRIESPANAGAATELLPLFPLGIVAFPGELVYLHVYEPRYRQLIGESAADGTRFGIVTVVPGGASSIGTEMQLQDILHTDDSGNMDIAARGIRTFRLFSFQRVVEGKLYSAGRVSFNRNDPRLETETQDALVELYNRIQEQAHVPRKLMAPVPRNLSFHIAHDVGLSVEQKLQLLTMPVEHDRQAYILAHLRRRQ